MKFGLFSSAQANSNDLPAETGRGGAAQLRRFAREIMPNCAATARIAAAAE